MFEYLLNGRDPETGEAYTLGDLACESVLLMVAGSQSTSGALCATFFYLAHHPDVLSKLRHEIHNTFPSPGEIHFHPKSPLGTLPFLRACIDESLRLSPPTPGHLPREVVGEGIAIDGCVYPPGTNVGVSPYAIHRTQVFRDPFTFMPERWLEGQALGAAFHPFSAGATGCPGRQLAIMELSLTVARLLWRFDLAVVGGDGDVDVEYRMRDFFVGEGSGPRLRLLLRPPERTSV
jgi:cytochrome P450